MKAKRNYIVIISCFSFVCLCLIGWRTWKRYEPWIYVYLFVQMDAKDNPIIRHKIAKRLTQLGPRSIKPIIEQFRMNGSWGPRTIRLNKVLREIGPESHRLLIVETNNEKNQLHKIFLIYSLQSSFHDFRYVSDWLQLLDKYPATTFYLEKQFNMHFEQGHPSIKIGSSWGEINPEFVNWYQLERRKNKKLPYWNPILSSTK